MSARKSPEHGEDDEGPEHHQLLVGGLAELLVLGLAVAGVDAQLARRGTVAEGEEGPHQQEQQEVKRGDGDQPGAEGDVWRAGGVRLVVGEVAAEDVREGHIGRRSDERRETADVAGEGDADHDGLREVGHLLAAVVILERFDEGSNVGDHHERGCRVGDPHRQEPRGEHDAEENRAGTLEAGGNKQGDAHVQVPLLHGQGQQEARHEHEDGVVEVLRSHRLARGDAPATDPR